MKKRFRIKIGLRAKFFFFFALFGIGMTVAIVLDLSQILAEIYKKTYRDSLMDIAEITEYNLGLTPEQMRYYARTAQIDAEYEKAEQQLSAVRELFDLESCYIIYPTGEDTAVWLMDASGESSENAGDEVKDYAAEASGEVRKVYKTGKKSDRLDILDQEDVSLISVFYPLKDENGATVAVLGVDKRIDALKSELETAISEVISHMFLLMLIEVTILLVFVQFGIVRAIRRLKQGVQELSDGNLNIELPGRRRDEIGDITRVFNRMAASIRGHIGEMEELNGAYQKFIPPETFAILRKKSIVDIRLGNQARANLTVLSMEPKSAKRVMPDFSSEQTFQYINGIFAQTVPAVLAYDGAVWGFEKAAVCAIYRDTAKQALASALAASRNLQTCGETLAAGIARGPVMVGIAGHEACMDIIGISEQTRLAARLTELAEEYHASILIGKSAASQIPGFAESYHTRFLGYLKLSERLEGVYDVYDGDGEEDRRQKQRTKELFEQGVALYIQEDYERAREAFIDVLRRYREDGAARKYLSLCDRAREDAACRGQAWFEKLRG